MVMHMIVCSASLIKILMRVIERQLVSLQLLDRVVFLKLCLLFHVLNIGFFHISYSALNLIVLVEEIAPVPT